MLQLILYFEERSVELITTLELDGKDCTAKSIRRYIYGYRSPKGFNAQKRELKGRHLKISGDEN